MRKALDYAWTQDGAWHLAVLQEQWSCDLQRHVLTRVVDQLPSKHPQTVEFDWHAADGTKKLFLKVFHAGALPGSLKDVARVSKAFRFWRQGLALASHGFSVPQTIAAGETRRYRLVERAFVLTERVDGQPLPSFLISLKHAPDVRRTLRLKRVSIMRLAEIIRRFHDLGFVHGDLLASNLFVGQGVADQPTVYFMDNDRTRRYPSWFNQSLWKRNLIQLNRMPLPGITLQDRMRFLQAYLGRKVLSRNDRRFARWLEEKTRKRRQECDGVDPTLDFRKLMRWTPGSACAQNANHSCS